MGTPLSTLTRMEKPPKKEPDPNGFSQYSSQTGKPPDSLWLVLRACQPVAGASGEGFPNAHQESGKTDKPRPAFLPV